MKLFLLGALSLLSVSSFAAPVASGPYLEKIVGDEASNNFVTCVVQPGQTTTTDAAGGKKIVALAKNSLEAKRFQPLIEAAAKTPVVKTSRSRETLPQVRITAGIAPQLSQFPLYLGSSGYERRASKQAAALLRIVAKECGSLKPAGGPRER